MNDIERTKKALQIAYDGFDYATDPDMIDCYIYEVNSVLKRYKFLLEQAAKLRPLPKNNVPLSTESTGGSLVTQALV